MPLLSCCMNVSCTCQHQSFPFPVDDHISGHSKGKGLTVSFFELFSRSWSLGTVFSNSSQNDKTTFLDKTCLIHLATISKHQQTCYMYGSALDLNMAVATGSSTTDLHMENTILLYTAHLATVPKNSTTLISLL